MDNPGQDEIKIINEIADKTAEQNPLFSNERKSQTITNKKSKVIKIFPLIIALFTTALLAVTGILFFSKQRSEIDTLKSQVQEKNTEIAEITENQNTAAKCDYETSKGDETVPNKINETNNDSSELKIPNLNNGKCLNCEQDTWFVTGNQIGFTSELLMLSVYQNKIMWSSIDWDNLRKQGWSVANTKSGRESNITVYLSQNIVDVFIGYFGNGAAAETILLLMEDGTVEYIPVRHAAHSGELRSYGKIVDVNNIVKFYIVRSRSGISLLAQRMDGDYYDLSKILLNTNYYKW